MRQYWRRGCLFVSASLLVMTSLVRADEPVSLGEHFPIGYQYRVSTRVELSGQLALPAAKEKSTAKPLSVVGESAIEYDERVLGVDKEDRVQKTIRIYRQMDFKRKVGDRPQQSALRPTVRRLVVLRHKNAEVPFSPDGPLTWGEIDLVRTDVFTPALAGLLPGRPVRPGESWTATTGAVEELTDMDQVAQGRLDCLFEQITTQDNRRQARIAFTGTVQGTNEDGPNRQRLDGYYLFDLQSNHLSYLSLNGTSTLLDREGKEVGKLEGRFVLSRQVQQEANDLSDAALKGIRLDPDEDNTQLLYENPDLGVQFQYPRRWRIGGIQGRQLTLETANGNGLLLTLEPAPSAPTAAVFLAETREWLQKQQARVLRDGGSQMVQPAPRQLEHFDLEVEMGKQRLFLDYYVFKQAAGGGTLAARLLPGDATVLQKEVARIARSVTLTRAPPIDKK